MDTWREGVPVIIGLKKTKGLEPTATVTCQDEGRGMGTGVLQ